MPGSSQFAEKAVRNTGMLENRVLSLSYGRIVVKPAEKLHGLVPESFETYQIVDPGDIIIRSTDLQNDWTSLRVGIVRDRGIISSAYLCLTARDKLTSEYAFQLLHSLDVMKVFYGLGTGLRQNLGFVDFKWLPLFVPPPEEQAAIVQYLGFIDGSIRRYVRGKQRLIGLLTETEVRLAHRAVTRRMEHSAPLKSSGVDWLGDIPAGWSVQRLKTICSMKSGENITAMSIDPTGAYPVYGGNAIWGYTDRYTHDGEYALVGRQGALCGNVHFVKGRFWASEHAVVTSARNNDNIEWLTMFLSVMNLNQYSMAAAQPGLAVDRIVNLYVPDFTRR